jgi:hypothetical protein
MDLYYLHLCLEIHANIGFLLDFLVSNHFFFFCVCVCVENWK